MPVYYTDQTKAKLKKALVFLNFMLPLHSTPIWFVFPDLRQSVDHSISFVTKVEVNVLLTFQSNWKHCTTKQHKAWKIEANRVGFGKLCVACIKLIWLDSAKLKLRLRQLKSWANWKVRETSLNYCLFFYPPCFLSGLLPSFVRSPLSKFRTSRRLINAA